MKYCDVCHSTYPSDFTTCPRDQAQLRSATELMPGMVIRGKYEIQGKIGSGGMATVYRARHMAFNEARALKVVSSRLMEDDNFLKRFRNEAVVTRKLQHPNAVRVDDIDTMEDGRPFIVMELVEGQNLRSIIEKEGPLEPARALDITRQAAAALAAAHSLGIVHRDIKPDNIVLVTRDGSDLVKVLDFGIAKLREGAGERGAGYTTTQTGMLIGTPQYVSPEQASGKPGEEIDGRSDIYSLGIVLFQMLTGKLPFESDTPMGLLLQHMQTPPPAPESVRPELKIDPSTTQLVLKCLEKDPAKRFQLAQELIASIRPAKSDPVPETRQMFSYNFQSTKPAPTVAATVATPAAKTVAVTMAAAAAPALAKNPTGHTGRWIALAIAVVVLAAAGYFYVGRQGKTDTPAATVVQPTAAAPAIPPPTPAAETQPTPTVTGATKTTDPEQERRVKELIGSGRRHLDNGEYAQAIRDLRQALQISPDNPTAKAALKRAELAKQTEEKVLGGNH